MESESRDAENKTQTGDLSFFSETQNCSHVNILLKRCPNTKKPSSIELGFYFWFFQSEGPRNSTFAATLRFQLPNSYMDYPDKLLRESAQTP